MLHSIPKKTLLILSLLLIRTEAFADSAILDLTGSNLIVSVSQYGGNQSLDLTTNGDNHDVEIIQKNTGDHTATISLTNSGGAYEFQLLQDSTTDQTVTVSGTCVTTTGCPVSITQSD